MRFMDLLQVTMPCGICRNSYKVFWRLNHTRRLMHAAVYQPPNRDDMAASIVAYALHNTVSIKLNKQHRFTFEETLENPIPNDDSPGLWEYLFVMGYNLNDNGETNKREHYHRFMEALLNMLYLFGYPRTYSVLRRHVPQIISADSQQEWVDALYWAYVTWTPKPMNESIVYHRFGVCDHE
jgi:hypothetical protein